MKTKLLYILLITLLLSNLVLLFLLINRPNHHRPPHKFLFEELNFNKEQLIKVNKLKDAHHQKRRGIDRDIRQLKNQFFNSISDKNKINSDSIADLIGKNEAKKDKEVLSYFRKIRTFCNEKQKAKFDKLILKALPKRRPNRPPPRR